MCPTILVKATKLGFYEHERRRPGQEFEMKLNHFFCVAKDGSLLKDGEGVPRFCSWVEPLEDFDIPEKLPVPQPPKEKKLRKAKAPVAKQETFAQTLKRKTKGEDAAQDVVLDDEEPFEPEEEVEDSDLTKESVVVSKAEKAKAAKAAKKKGKHAAHEDEAEEPAKEEAPPTGSEQVI